MGSRTVSAAMFGSPTSYVWPCGLVASPVKAETARRIRRIEARLAKRLAVIEGIHARQLFCVGLDQIRQLEKPYRALGGRRPWPRPVVKSFTSRADGIFDIIGIRFGRVPENRIIHGIDVFARAARLGRDEAPVDVISEGSHPSI